MEPPRILLCVLLGPIGALLAYRLFFPCIAAVRSRLWSAILRYCVQPRIFPEFHSLNPTRAQVLLVVLHWTSTVFCNIYGTHSLVQIASRAGLIALIHLVPLFAAPRLSLVSHALGISLGVVRYAHAALGIMATTQAAFHSITLAYARPSTGTPRAINLTGMVAMALLMSGPLGRHLAYEIFLSSHLLFAVVLAIMTWIHVYSLERLTEILLVISAGCFALCLSYQVIHQCYRNIAFSPFGVTRIVHVEQATQVTRDTPTSSDRRKTPRGCLMLRVRLPRPFPVQPGQYVYLTVLSSIRSTFQRHPFVVAWWTSQDGVGSNSKPLHATDVQSSGALKNQRFSKSAQDIYLLIDQRMGWTSYIQRFGSALLMQRAWLDGPYGSTTDFHRYGCVLLFATGTGLFAVLPVIKRLMELIHNAAAYTQTIRLVWYTDQLYDPMGDWMDELLNADAEKRLLQISIHSGVNPSNQKSANNWGHRMARTTEIPDIPGYLRGTLSEELCEIAIVVSAFPEFRHAVRSATLREETSRTKLVELEYQPDSVLPLKGGTVV